MEDMKILISPYDNRYIETFVVIERLYKKNLLTKVILFSLIRLLPEQV